MKQPDVTNKLSLRNSSYDLLRCQTACRHLNIIWESEIAHFHGGFSGGLLKKKRDCVLLNYFHLETSFSSIPKIVFFDIYKCLIYKSLSSCLDKTVFSCGKWKTHKFITRKTSCAMPLLLFGDLCVSIATSYSLHLCESAAADSSIQMS